VSHTPASAFYTLSLHDALPILAVHVRAGEIQFERVGAFRLAGLRERLPVLQLGVAARTGHDRRDEDVIRVLFLDAGNPRHPPVRSEEHTSELQSRENLVCRLLL